MIHSDFFKHLTEDEQCLLHAVCEHVFNSMGLQGCVKWYQMMRPAVLAQLVRKVSNLKSEYQDLSHVLASKLETHVF